MRDIVPFVNDIKNQVIGFDSLWDDLMHPNFNFVDNKFPKDNLIVGDNTVIIELALAGFSKDEINIERDKGRLIVTGKQKQKDEETNMRYVHRNIAMRAFTKTYTVAPEYQDIDAQFIDGILSIHLEKQPDEEKQKELIEIK